MAINCPYKLIMQSTVAIIIIMIEWLIDLIN